MTAENDSLRLLLEQAGIDAKALLVQAGIDAKEREAADKLQKLILEEMHHRIKNTLATVSAIASQSLRTATSIQYGEQAIEGRLIERSVRLPDGTLLVELPGRIDRPTMVNLRIQ